MREKKNKVKIIIFAITIMMIILACFIYQSNQAKSSDSNTIKIGIVTYYGYEPEVKLSFGVGTLLGAEAYINKVNNHGGVNGKKISLIIKYTNTPDELEAIKSAEEILNNHQVVAFMFPFCKLQTRGIKKVLAQTQLPILFPVSGYGISDESIFYDRPSYQNEYDDHLENFLKTRPKNERIALLTEKDEMCYNIRSTFLKSNQQFKKNIVADIFYSNLSEFKKVLLTNSSRQEKIQSVKKYAKPIVEKIVNLKPDLVYFSSRISGSYIFRLFKNAKPMPEFVSISSYPIESHANLYKDIFKNNFYATTIFPIPSRAKNLQVMREFIEDMKSTNIKESELTTIMFEGYIGARILVETLKNAGADLTHNKLKDTLENTSNLDIGGMKFSFTKNNHHGNNKSYFYKFILGNPTLINDNK